MKTITNRLSKRDEFFPPISTDDEAILRSLIFKQGGVAGAVRRIIARWNGRFAAVQIKIAMSRRYPLLVPNKFQVDDCIDWLEKRRFIVCVVFRHSRIYERRRSMNRLVLTNGIRSDIKPASPAVIPSPGNCALAARAFAPDAVGALNPLQRAVAAFNEAFDYAMELPIDKQFFPSMISIAEMRGRGDIAASIREATRPCACEICREERQVAA